MPGDEVFSKRDLEILASPPGGAATPQHGGTLSSGPAAALDARGNLIFEESPEEMELERRTIRRGGFALAGLVGPLMCFLFFLLYYWLEVCSGSLIIMMVTTVAVFGAAGVWFYMSSYKIRPWRMYDGGVAFTTYPIIMDKFLPYDGIIYIRELSNFMMKDGISIRWTGGEGINLFMASPRTPAILEFIKTKMGKPATGAAPPERLSTMQQLEQIASGKPVRSTAFEPVPFPHEKAVYLAAMVIALPLTALLLLLLPPSARGTYWYVPFAFYPVIAIWSLGAASMGMQLYARAKKLQVRFDIKVIGALLLMFNIVLASELAFADPIASALGTGTVELVSTPPPSSSYPLPDNISGQTIELNRSILVAQGRHVLMDNCTFNFHCTRPGELSLWVAEGASLEAVNCIFCATDPGNGFGCEFHGPATLANCTFRGVWGDMSRLNGDGGVEIWNSQVSLSGCIIQDAATNGLFIVGCRPVISDTRITDCGDENIEMHRAEPLLLRCSLSNAGWGIIAWEGSFLRMENCSVRSINDTGIELVNSRAEILNCTLEDIKEAAIMLRSSELVSYKGTTFSRVGEEVAQGSLVGLNGTTCLISVVMISGLIMLNIAISGRQRLVASRRP